MGKNIVRNVVLDAPTDKDLFRGKGHERTAISLAKAIMAFDQDDRAIGLDGPWGSGKSSVVEIAAKYLDSEYSDHKVRYHFFTFDIWKSQGAGFRRSFLEHFVSWAIQEFPQKKSQLRALEEDIRGKKREVSTNNQPILGWFGVIVLFLLPLLPIYYFWAKVVFDELAKTGKTVDFFWSSPFIVFGIFTLGALVATLKKKYIDHNGSLGFKTALSSVLLISSRQHQDHMSVQKIREIDPNDYEFHTTLRQVLGTVQSDYQKVVVVLDNIDRLPQKEIKDYWAIVRSIFSGAHKSGKVAPNETITAIVPYDRAHIEGNSGEDGDASEREHNDRLTRLSSRELFSKTFDEVLNIAPPVLSNAREFFAAKLEEALPKQINKYDGFRTYRIFAELLRIEGGLTTPRQVVSFVNDISGLFALHEGQFSVPTLAAYLAHQDLVSKNPGTLNDETKLDAKIVDLASDPDLAKNFAAIVFNVSPDLAFEVLLDNELIAASIAQDHQELERLSKSPGFDLRVDDVVLSNSEQWISTGDFGAAILNFGKVMPNHQGAAKPRVVNALVQGFNSIENLSIQRKFFEPFLSLFDLIPASDRPILVSEFVKKTVVEVIKAKGANFSNGAEFAEFLGISDAKFQSLSLKSEFRAELRRLSLNSAADFLYGLAVNIEDNGLSLDCFGSAKIILPDEGNYYQKIAIEDPATALIALKQFRLLTILREDEWAETANTCLEECAKLGKPEAEITNLLEIICLAHSQLEREERKELSLSAVLGDGQFFQNLGGGGTEASSKSIALALFLVAEAELGNELRVPTILQPGGQRAPSNSEEFIQFNELVKGTSDLSDMQAIWIAEKAAASRNMPSFWTKFASANTGHLAVQRVVKAAYLSDTVPNTSLYGLNLYYEYLTDLLGVDEFVNMLSRFEPRVTEAKLSETKLDQVSSGFLNASHLAKGSRWKLYHDHIESLLRAVPGELWLDHIQAYDHTAQLLAEKLTSSGCSLDSSKFREPLIQAMLDILSDQHIPNAPDGAFDTLKDAIDKRHHAIIWRTLREKAVNVSPASLDNAVRLFPSGITQVISEGDKVSAAEKDNLLRYILCPALEGDNVQVLDAFVRVGSKRLSDFKRSADESTVKLLEGTLDAFSKSTKDRTWARRVVETIQGKQRARTFLEVVWGLNKDSDSEPN